MSEETTKKSDWLGGRVKARNRKAKSDSELVREIVDAWNNPGEYPKYHKQMQGMLRHSWPSLSEPVRELAGRAKKMASLNEEKTMTKTAEQITIEALIECGVTGHVNEDYAVEIVAALREAGMLKEDTDV